MATMATTPAVINAKPIARASHADSAPIVMKQVASITSIAPRYANPPDTPSRAMRAKGPVIGTQTTQNAQIHTSAATAANATVVPINAACTAPPCAPQAPVLHPPATAIAIPRLTVAAVIKLAVVTDVPND